MSEAKPITEEIARDAYGMYCECGGYADRDNPTEAEDTEYGCGRQFGCCSRAFVCRVCGTRWVGAAPAPEADEDDYAVELEEDGEKEK